LANHPREQVVIFGYSQSGDIIAKTQRNFANDPATAPPKDQVSFVVTGDTNRPNGGILARFPGLYIPGLNITFDGAAPTDTGYQTTDIAFEYDPVADFPQYPIDILADLNSLVGFLDVHATYPNPYLPLPAGIPFFPTALPDGYTPAELQQAMNDRANRQTCGDTTYITVPAINLPLLQPLLDIGTDTGTGWLTKPIVDLIQPTLRVLIDLGYNRTIPYGQPTPAGLLPKIDPSTLTANLSAAVSQGVHDALADLGVTAVSPPAPSTAANPSTSANAQAADSPTATPQNTKPLPQSQSTHAAAITATTPKTGPAMYRAHTLAATSRSSAAAASVATKPEKPTSSSPVASGLPPVTPLTASDIGTPNMPSTKTAVPASGASPNATGATSSQGRHSATAHAPSSSAASSHGGRWPTTTL
jgi:hypothetical protein